MGKLYTATATAKGGGSGRVTSKSGVLDLPFSGPAELGGEGGRATNPEELMAVGWATCFDTALMMAAKKKGLDVGSTEVTVAVSVLPDGGVYKLAANIDVRFMGIGDEDAKRLMQMAHKLCLYSKSMRGNVDVETHYSI